MADTVNINQPGLPEYERRTDSDKTTTSGGGTSTMQLAPEATAALGGMDSAIDQQKQVASAQGDLKVQGATEDNAVEQGLNAQQQQLADEKMKVLQGQFAQTGELYQQQKARIKQQQDRYEAMDAPALFANRDKAAQYRLGIGVALAGLGDAMRQSAMIRIGKDPGSASTVKDIINNDLDRQKDAINKARDSVLQARTGLKDIDDARNAALGDIDMKGAILAKKAADQMRANLAARGVPQAQIDKDKNIADLDQFAASKNLDVAGNLHTTIDKHFSTAIKNGSEEINRAPTATNKSGSLSASDMQNVSNLTRDIGYLQKTEKLIQANPKAYEEARKALESAQEREAVESVPGVGKAAMAGAKALGIAPVSPEQGLSPPALEIYRGLHQAQMAVASGWGGVIRDSDVKNASTQLGVLGSDSKQAASALREVHSTLQNNLDNYLGNRPVSLVPGTPGSGGGQPAAPGAPPTASAPAAPPAQAEAPVTPVIELPRAQRERMVEGLRKMKPGPGRDAMAAKYGITEGELDGR